MKVTRQQKETIEQWRLDGMSVTEIARKMEIPRATVNYYCTRNLIEPEGWKQKFPKKNGDGHMRKNGVFVRYFTKEEDKIILKMRREGASLADIGRKVGRNMNVVGDRLYTLARHEERELA